MRTLQRLAVLAFGTLISCAAHAALITHEFSGMITEVQLWGPDPLNGQIQVGMTLSGFYQFDDSQAPACNAALSQCYREFAIPPYRLSFAIGSLTFEAENEFEISVNDDKTGSGSDWYNIYSQVDFGSWLNVAMALGLSDPTGTAIDDATDLLLKPPKLNDFAEHVFKINGSFDQGYVTGNIEKFKRVPEPGTLALLGLSLAGLAFTRHRKR